MNTLDQWAEKPDEEQKESKPSTLSDWAEPAEAQKPVWDDQYLPRNIGVVRDTMRAVRGGIVDDWDDEETIDKYLSTMRAFESGNTVSTYRFLQGMVGSDEETLQRIGEGIKLYDNMGSAFGEGASWADTRQAVGDYAESIILDPANLLGLGLGKLAVGAGTKTVATAAKVAGIKALREGGEKFGNQMFKKAITEAGKKTAADIAKRTAETQAKKGVGKLATRAALKDAGVALATDTAVAIGTEYVYQTVRKETGVQEDVQLSHVALAALGTMVVGGAAYGTNLFRGASGYKPSVRALNEEADAGAVIRAITKRVDEGNWAEKVARGTELEDLDGEYWIDLMDAMLPAMEQEGYVWVRRSEDDKVSNWIADIIKTAEPEDAKEFATNWSKATGIELPSLDKEGLDFFADTFAFKMNQAARLMEKTSRISRSLGKKVDEVTYGDILQDAVVGTNAAPFGRKAVELGGEKVKAFQNNIIRLIVSNLSTTRLNLVGYGVSSAMNTFSDVSQGILYGGFSPLVRMAGRAEKADDLIRMSKSMFSMQQQKARNLLDPNTTFDQFLAYTQMRPNQLRELTTVLQGGIEDPSAIAKNFGVKPSDTVIGARLEQGVNVIQKINFVQAQDVYTKSQEFLYQMDKKVRVAFDRALPDMLQDTNLKTLMADPRWAKAEAEAVYETQRAIYSATYRRSGSELGRLAAFIEDFRNIPFIGLTIPFGRFFNNVIATTMDYSGLSIITKAAGYQPNRSYADLASRAAVSWSVVSMLAEQENDYIERGLGTFESENAKGEVVDNRYTYPLSLFKGAARIVAYHRKGEEPPKNVVDDMLQHIKVWDTIYDTVSGGEEIPSTVVTEFGEFAIGQLTRDLSDATNNIVTVVRELLSKEKGEGVYKDLVNLVSQPLVAAVSGATRTLEPLNVAAKMLEGVDMEVLDPKDGNRIFNEAFRYIDEWGSTSEVQRYDVASGRRAVQADKYFADRSSKLTNTERVLNLVGVTHWTMNTYTDSPEANNVFNMYFHSFLEDKATKLMENEKFRNGSLEVKRVMWGDVKAAARDHVKKFMALKAGDTQSYKMIVDIYNSHSKGDIAKAVDTIAPGTDIGDMSLPELKTLASYLKFRKDQIRMRN